MTTNNGTNRPRTEAGGSLVTTPRAAEMMKLLRPGLTQGGVTLSRDEYEALKRVYGFTKEKPNEKPPPPVAPLLENFKSRWEYEVALRKHERALEGWNRWEDPRALMQSPSSRCLVRSESRPRSTTSSEPSVRWGSWR